MIINCRDQDWSGAGPWWLGAKCFLDGVQIAQVHYVDTEQGIVKSYDVFGDGKAHALHELGIEPPGGVEDLGWGLMSKTLRGKVELVVPETQRA
jgi:hypothetical protein